MPRIVKKPTKSTASKNSRTVSAAATNKAVNGEILTLAEAAAYLRVPETEVVRLVRQQDLPGRLLGEEWRFLKSAVQDWLRTPPRGKRGILAHVGAFKDDPDLEAIVEQAYRRRDQSVTEDA